MADYYVKLDDLFGIPSLDIQVLLYICKDADYQKKNTSGFSGIWVDPAQILDVIGDSIGDITEEDIEDALINLNELGSIRIDEAPCGVEDDLENEDEFEGRIYRVSLSHNTLIRKSAPRSKIRSNKKGPR